MLRFATLDLVPALKEGLRSASVGPARERARRALVVSEVALALTLLAGAGLMTQSFWRLKTARGGGVQAARTGSDLPLGVRS
ncbi:MAG: hypothetical protein HYV20_07085 [Gemmatimonadetes bacterium]|nr:hypothetical protein [Gemmatimonadota bacterium]